MVSATFSPGPWRWSDINDDTYEPGRLLRADGVQIGFARKGGTAADSRLVAAAPELLELLEALRTTWNSATVDGWIAKRDRLIARIVGGP